MTPPRLCPGLGMQICATCYRNADNHTPEVRVAHPQRISPHARPPHCADWLAIPECAIDASHSRL